MIRRTVLSFTDTSSNRIVRILSLSLSFFFTTVAFAQNNNILSAGTAWPAFNLAPESNPVGAIYAGSTFLSFSAATANPASTAYTVGGRFGTRLGRSLGFVAGADYSLQGGALSVPYAVAYGPKNFGIGVGGNIFGVHNLGLIFGMLAKTRFGILWSNFIGLGSSGLGLGVATSLGRSIKLGLDAGTALNALSTWTLRPGILVGVSSLSLNVSYGVTVGSGGISGGTPSLGLALPIGKFNLQAFYNIVSVYYASLTMKL